MASISPSGVNAGSYNPTNTQAAACPTTGSDWNAASNLPPTPNSELCDCMFKSLTCVPNNVATDDVGKLFGIVCGLVDGVCDGIQANGSTGHYGAYGMCDPQQQLGFALNAYYQNQISAGNGASACGFSGSAKTQAAASPTGTCSGLIAQAGTAGTGTVTSQPTGTGSSSSGSGSTSSGAGVPGVSFPSYIGLMQIAVYLTVALVSGGGMILL